MKLLFIAGDINRIGGIEKYNKDLLAAFNKAGAKTLLVERYKGGLLAKISFVVRVVWRFINTRPDAIHCGHLNFSPVCLLLGKLFGTPYTLALYGIEIIDIRGKLRRSAVAGAEKLVTISGYSRGLILKQFPEAEDRIFMLPSAVDGSIFKIQDKDQALVKKYGITGRPTILSLARLATQEHKGQDRVLAALPYLLEKIPNAVYLIVGGGTDDRVNAVLEKHPELVNNVVFTGPAPNEARTDYYNLGDVYVLPSKYEGFSIVFIESLSCGVPVIASDGYGCREGLLDGELGTLVPPDDLRAIADAIVTILSHTAPPQFYDRQYLRKRTLDIYGMDIWGKRVAQLVELLSKSLRKRSLAIFMSHPIQYQAPLLAKIAKNPDFNTHTYFYWDFGVKETFEADFNKKIKWDIPVLDGYKYTFLRNYSFRPSSRFWGVINPGVMSEIIRRRYDAILIFGWAHFSNWLAIITAMLTGTRVLLHAETPMNQEIFKKGLKSGIRNVVLKQLFKRVTAFLYIGSENRKFYEYFGVPRDKLFFAPYAVDNERYFREDRLLPADRGALKKAAGVPDKAPVILFVGKLSDKKRPLDLLKAYELLLGSWRGGEKPALVYVGDGPLRGMLERYTADHNLTSVLFAGFRNQLELSSYYAIADVFVLPSGFGETWGLVVNEAMCFGVPVIVSDMVGCGGDLVLQGENGYVFPLGDYEQMARCLSAILSNEAMRKKHGELSRRIIMTYSQEKDVEAIQSALYSYD